MTATITAPKEAAPSRPDGQSDRSPALRLRGPRRERNMPWVVIGVLLVAGSALAFSVWASGASSRTPVLALARSVEAGQTLTAADVTTVEVALGASTPTVTPDRLAQIEGRVALTSMPAGTLLQENLFAGTPPVAADHALVGVALAVTDLPHAELRSGDAVLAVVTPDPAASTAAPVPAGLYPASVFAARPVDDEMGGNTALVTLDVAQRHAPLLASAAAADRLRLVILRDLGDLDPAILEAFSATETPGTAADPSAVVFDDGGDR